MDLNNLYKSDASGIIKSCTLNPNGNPKPKYYFNGKGSINSNGLENLGLDFYINYINLINTNPLVDVSKNQKPLILSVLVK